MKNIILCRFLCCFQLKYFNNMLPGEAKASEEEMILIYVPSFFNQLGELLEKTPKR